MRALWLCSIAFTLASAQAADLPAPKLVHFATCTAAGVEHGCLVARGDDGKLYNVSGAVPGLKAKQWLQGSAAVSNRVSYCMQGETVADFTPDPAQKPVACHRD